MHCAAAPPPGRSSCAARARSGPTSTPSWPSLAADAPRGHLPRAFVGEQNYWTLVGVDGGGERSALLSEDGALEVGRGGFSVEPAVRDSTAGAPVTWADVQLDHSLRDGYLPLPAVHWQHASFTLDIEAAADGPAAAPRAAGALHAAQHRQRGAHASRCCWRCGPWQVNPPQQFLTTPGGARRIDRLEWHAPTLSVNGAEGPRFAAVPDRATALPGDGGLDLRVPARRPAAAGPDRRAGTGLGAAAVGAAARAGRDAGGGLDGAPRG